ncbi:MAG: hypothetical protein MAG453_00435 [Calditrichaeota bacterium]|nr:hypothetical protein [Calditrichota bacterium]
MGRMIRVWAGFHVAGGGRMNVVLDTPGEPFRRPHRVILNKRGVCLPRASVPAVRACPRG